MTNAIKYDPECCGGKPAIAGTRFPVSQLLAEFAEGYSLAYIALNFHLKRSSVVAVLREISKRYDHPYNRAEIANEIWAAAQRHPDEGVEDCVARIEAILREHYE